MWLLSAKPAPVEQFESVLRGDETMAGIAVFDFSEAQAKAIAERRLYQLSRLDVNKVQDEHEELKLVIADLQDILGSRPRRLTILKQELAELVDRHGDERRSFIDPMPSRWTARTSLKSGPSSSP